MKKEASVYRHLISYFIVLLAYYMVLVIGHIGILYIDIILIQSENNNKQINNVILNYVC